MRFKILLLLSPLLLLTTAIFANPVYDSIGVENQNGKKVVIHKVDAKETYFAIGRRYNVKPNLIIQFNNNVPLHPGMTIKVPTELPFANGVLATTTRETKTITSTLPTSTQQYKVAAHETLYSIAKRFGLTVDEVKAQNNLRSDILSPGQVLNITTGASQSKTETTVKETPAYTPPAPQPRQQVQQPPVQQPPVIRQPAQQQPAQTQQPTAQAQQAPVNTQNTQQYKVSNGETLYTIAKRFNTSVDDITALNKLTSPNITPGQILVVRNGMPPAPKQVLVTRPDTTMVAATDSVGTERRMPGNRYGLFEKTEKGPAVTMDDAGLDKNRMLALHRTAPIGTVIKVTNPMTNRSAFVKVVGRFTDNESNKDAVIVITKNVSDALGAMDKRFRVNLTYGVPVNE